MSLEIVAWQWSKAGPALQAHVCSVGLAIAEHLTSDGSGFLFSFKEASRILATIAFDRNSLNQGHSQILFQAGNDELHTYLSGGRALAN